MNVGIQIGGSTPETRIAFDALTAAIIGVINTAASDAVKLSAMETLRKASGLSADGASISNSTINMPVHHHHNAPESMKEPDLPGPGEPAYDNRYYDEDEA